MAVSSRELERFKTITDDSIFAFWDALIPYEDYTCHQQELLQAVQDSTLHPKARYSNDPGCDFIAAKSGQGPGKTRALAVVGLWRTFRRYKARTYMTAPSMHQAQTVYLTEVRDLLDRAPPEISKFFASTATKVIVCGVEDWELRVKTASKDTGIQGLHHPNLTILADEASGIARSLMEALEGTCTQRDNLFVATGNPNTRDCYFFDCFHLKRDFWKCLTFNTLDSPIVDADKVIRDLIIYGVNSDYVRVRIFGQFPHQDPNAVFSSDDLELCTQVPIEVAGRVYLDGVPRKAFGIDLARMGSDKSVIYRRQGQAVLESRDYNKTEPLDVIAEAIRMQTDNGWRSDQCVFVLDAGGLGGATVPMLTTQGRQCFEFHFGGRPRFRKTYYDRVSEAYFLLARRVKQSAQLIREANDPAAGTIRIPDDSELIHQLCSRLYNPAFQRGGSKKMVLKLESKEEYMKRIKQTRSADTFTSPDKADALALCFYPYVQVSLDVAEAGSLTPRIGEQIQI